MADPGGWKAVREAVRERVGDSAFGAWFENLDAEADGQKLIVRCPDRFSRDWIRGRYADVIGEAARGAARMTDMMLTGRVYNAQDGEKVGFAQYLVPEGQAFAKAFELAVRVAQNAPLTNYALMHALPRIAEQPADQGFFTEAMMAAIAQSAPEAKSRLADFLEGRAAKVRKD